MIQIYCGDGKGKTTASVGLAVRMAGYNKKVLFIQFLKGSYTGELEILEKSDSIKVFRCDKNYGFTFNMSDEDKKSITSCHNKNLDFAVSYMKDFDMIVLDEIFAAVNCSLVNVETVKLLCENYTGELVMTGREPDIWFTERADYISEIRKVKHPYDRGEDAREGIEF